MDAIDREILWRQFGAAIDMFGSALADSPTNCGKRDCGKTRQTNGWQPASRHSGQCSDKG